MEKISGVVATVAAFLQRVNMDMEVVDLESTSTMEVFLAAVKSTIFDANKGDASIAVIVDEISVTFMLSLENDQQVAKIRMARAAKPTEISRVRVG